MLKLHLNHYQQIHFQQPHFAVLQSLVLMQKHQGLDINEVHLLNLLKQLEQLQLLLVMADTDFR